jgi:hypothetical protein
LCLGEYGRVDEQDGVESIAIAVLSIEMPLEAIACEIGDVLRMATRSIL